MTARTDPGMERLSRLAVVESEQNTLALASSGLPIRLKNISRWFLEKGRQLITLPRDQDLIRAVLSEEKAPIEGSRYRRGECLNVYRADGSRIRPRICGVRSGGFSNVYTVIDLDEMKPYCLKENRALPGDEIRKNEKLAVEACIGLRMGRHPHIVATYEAFHLCSRLFILTEYLPSISLDVQLKEGALDLAPALKYAVHICRAMQYAQSTLAGFVHGDIKPGNCLITSLRTLKLGDFGQASANGIGKQFANSRYASGRDGDDPDASFGWGGTGAYMAPEMFDIYSPNRNLADVYAFGVTLFEMLSGSRPFVAASKHEMAELHRTGELPLTLLSDVAVPSSIIDLIRRCLAKLPSERPANFALIEDELQQAFADRFGRTVEYESEAEFTNLEVSRRAVSLASIGRVDDAVATIDAATHHSGESPDLLAAKAISLVSGLRLDEAHEAGTSALMMHVESLAVLLANARVLMARGKTDRAEDYLFRALKAAPDNCTVLNMMGKLALKTGRCNEALGYFGKSAMLDAAQVEAWAGLARARLLSDRPDKAVRLAKRAVSIDPHDADSQTLLADIYRLRQEFPKAVVSYKSALRSSFRKETAKNFIRSCRSMYTEAGGEEIDPQLARILVSGTRFFRRGGSSAAEHRFLQRFLYLLRREDHNPLLFFFLDDAFALVGDRMPKGLNMELSKSLETVLTRSIDRKVPIYCLSALAKVLYHLGTFSECQTVAHAMLRQHGPSEIAFYYLAACSEINGDFRDSLTFYRKALRLEDCEDTRTGICRVSAKLRERHELGPRGSVDRQTWSAQMQ